LTYFTAFFGIEVFFSGVLFIFELFAMNEESNVALKIPGVERYSNERMRKRVKNVMERSWITDPILVQQQDKGLVRR